MRRNEDIDETAGYGTSTKDRKVMIFVIDSVPFFEYSVRWNDIVLITATLLPVVSTLASVFYYFWFIICVDDELCIR